MIYSLYEDELTIPKGFWLVVSRNKNETDVDLSAMTLIATETGCYPNRMSTNAEIELCISRANAVDLYDARWDLDYF